MTIETALVSALVAALVTLAIEWAAKPSLEARKARLLKRVDGELALADSFAAMDRCAREISDLSSRAWSVSGNRHAVVSALREIQRVEGQGADAFDSVAATLPQSVEVVGWFALGAVRNTIHAGLPLAEQLAESPQSTGDSTGRTVDQVLPEVCEWAFEASGFLSCVVEYLRSKQLRGIRRFFAYRRAMEGAEFHRHREPQNIQLRNGEASGGEV